MNISFALYTYFPYGGLQKDMLSIAKECALRGHKLTIYCYEWRGEKPHDVTVCELPVKGASNHRRNLYFHQQLTTALQLRPHDILVVFEKIPAANIYYAADSCFKAKLYNERHWLLRWLPRYRTFVKHETAIFKPGCDTHIFALQQKAIDEYRHFYKTEAERFTLLPPGISKDRINAQGEKLNILRTELDINKDHAVILFVGSGYKTKGLDRAIRAVAMLNQQRPAHLVIAGEDKKSAYSMLAAALTISANVHFLGGRDDVPLLLKSADLLIHPARRENTGTVLLEAAVAGLPVLTTAVCGYSCYIRDHKLGIVMAEPYEQEKLTEALASMFRDPENLEQYSVNGLNFAKTAQIYQLKEKATDIIESWLNTHNARSQR